MPDRSSQLTQSIKQRIFWRDFTRNLSFNTISQELVVLENDKSVMNAIENLVMTNNGERFYHPEIGSTIPQQLFGLMGYQQSFQEDLIEEQIVNMLKVQEPRATNVNVTIDTFPTENYITVTISFSVINTPNQVFSLPIEIPIRG